MTTPSSAFITGARGFVGRHLAERWRAEGSEVRGVDLAADPGSGVVAGDVTGPGPWEEHAAGCDVVVHTAAIVSNFGSRGDFWRANVVATRRAIDAAVRAGAHRFVHFSSVRAFGDRGFPDGVDESHPVRPDGNLYVDTKIASEQVVLQAHAAGEIECVVVRPGDIYGPGSRPWTVAPVEALRRGPVLLPARGLVSPVYVDNLLDGVAQAAAREKAAGRVFTITDGAGVPAREFFGHYSRMLGKGAPPTAPTPVVVAFAEVIGRLERLRGRQSELGAAAILYLTRTGTYSIERARRELGYEPRIDLAEGMRRTEVWLRAEGFLT